MNIFVNTKHIISIALLLIGAQAHSAITETRGTHTKIILLGLKRIDSAAELHITHCSTFAESIHLQFSHSQDVHILMPLQQLFDQLDATLKLTSGPARYVLLTRMLAVGNVLHKYHGADINDIFITKKLANKILSYATPVHHPDFPGLDAPRGTINLSRL